MSKADEVTFFRMALAAGCAVLLACGPGTPPAEAEPGDTPAAPGEVSVQALSASNAPDVSCPAGTLCAPTVSLSCTRARTSTGTINCTASATGGVPPYRYFWQTEYFYLDSGYTWVRPYAEGTSKYGPESCPFGRYADPQEWDIYVSVYAVDANGYGSNVADAAFDCVKASTTGG